MYGAGGIGYLANIYICVKTLKHKVLMFYECHMILFLDNIRLNPRPAGVWLVTVARGRWGGGGRERWGGGTRGRGGLGK